MEGLALTYSPIRDPPGWDMGAGASHLAGAGDGNVLLEAQRTLGTLEVRGSSALVTR